MASVLDWLRENASLIVIFLLFWCSIYLERIARHVDTIRGMLAVEEARRERNELS